MPTPDELTRNQDPQEVLHWTTAALDPRALTIVRYCAEEVTRQHAEPIKVYNMVQAWSEAIRMFERDIALTPQLVESFGKIVEPTKNASGFRNGQVYVGGHVPPRADEVPALMRRWNKFLEDMSPEQAYLEFEWIHPFFDGCRRVGKIILCYKAGTLHDPYRTEIPNPHNVSNP